MGENIGEFSYIDYLEEKALVNVLQIKYRYRIFCKFEGKNFGDWPLICQIRQCFLPPTFSAIQYYGMVITYFIITNCYKDVQIIQLFLACRLGICTIDAVRKEGWL